MLLKCPEAMVVSCKMIRSSGWPLGSAREENVHFLLKNKVPQPRLLYPAKLSFRIKGPIESFPDKKNLKQFITAQPVLQEKLKGLL